MKVLVVGLNPSRKGGSSPTLKRLYMWMDYLNLQYVSFINLYEGYEISESSCNSAKIREYSKEYDKIISLGTSSSSALNRMDIDHFDLPHPSGLNRKLNDHNYVHERLELCKNYLRSKL